MNYRDSASFGKRQEYVVIAELLRRGFDVYMTLVDDRGIDCIIRLNDDCYIDVQIKARSVTAKQPNLFSAMSIRPRDNYFFIFYIEANDSLWVIPSNDVVQLASENKTGKNAGKFSLSISREATEKGKEFQKYSGEAGFNLLRNFACNKV